jgi:thioredoxin 2
MFSAGPKSGQDPGKESASVSPNQPYTFRCPSCSTKNRIPADKAGRLARCGRCGTSFSTRILLERKSFIVTDGNFEQNVLRSPLPVVMFAWAPWCPTCGAMAPVMDAFARDAGGRIRVGKLNVDANPVLASRFDVRSVPFLYVFDNGRLVESLPGGLQPHDLRVRMARYL